MDNIFVFIFVVLIVLALALYGVLLLPLPGSAGIIPTAADGALRRRRRVRHRA